MTTETAGTRSAPRGPGQRGLVGAAGAALGAGAVIGLVGALTAGQPAALGALAGAGGTVAVFGFGSAVVDLVSRAWPALSLLVALLTYVLQVATMAALFSILDGSGALDSALDRRWLGVSVIATVLVWLSVQVPLTLTRRIPTYDLARKADQ